MGTRKYRDYSEKDLENAVKESLSISDVLRKLDLRIAGGNFDNIRKRIAQLNLDTSHFTKSPWKGKSRKQWAEYKKPAGRKKFLIRERGYKCEECELEEWRGEKIVLELHHVNGNRLDNRKENLKLLCCNCHSITPNWRNKNAGVAELVDAADLDDKLSDQDESSDMNPVKFGETLTDNADGNPELSLPKWKKSVENRRREPKFCECGASINRNSKMCLDCYHVAKRSKIPKVPEILKAFEEKKSYLQVGKHFGVSDNAVHKWVKSYGLQDMVKGYSSARKD